MRKQNQEYFYSCLKQFSEAETKERINFHKHWLKLWQSMKLESSHSGRVRNVIYLSHPQHMNQEWKYHF